MSDKPRNNTPEQSRSSRQQLPQESGSPKPPRATHSARNARVPKLAGPLAVINHFVDTLPPGTRLLVAFSGGLDSHVLLHVCSAARLRRQDITLEAVHVDHNLQPESKSWVSHCAKTAAELDIGFHLQEVLIDEDFEQRKQQQGLEAAARHARYSAFAKLVQTGDLLLLAQHADDQAETFLLQALRGSGPDGLAGIPASRRFGGGTLMRPLLGCTREELESYAERHNLDFITDPSNADLRFDRNYLRHQIMPLLAERWPAANRTLSRAAARSQAASSLLIRQAGDDLSRVLLLDHEQIDVRKLMQMPLERRFNVLRYWVRSKALDLPALKMLQEVETGLLAQHASGGTVRCSQYEFRRHRNRLYLLSPVFEPVQSFCHAWPERSEELVIPEIKRVLRRSEAESQGLQIPKAADVEVRSRKGGELIALGEPVIHKSVKKLLQEADVPEWQRGSVPLIYIDGDLAAVWNIVVSQHFLKAGFPRSAVNSDKHRREDEVTRSRGEFASTESGERDRV